MTADQGRLVILRSLKILRLDPVGEGCIRKVGQTHELCLSSGMALWRFHSHLKQSRGKWVCLIRKTWLINSIRAFRLAGSKVTHSALHFAANREMGATPIEPAATSHHARDAPRVRRGRRRRGGWSWSCSLLRQGSAWALQMQTLDLSKITISFMTFYPSIP